MSDRELEEFVGRLFDGILLIGWFIQLFSFTYLSGYRLFNIQTIFHRRQWIMRGVECGGQKVYFWREGEING